MFAIALAIVLCAGEAVSPAPAADTYTDEFVLTRNRVLLPVWLNEQGPYPFLLDVAGAVNAVDAEAAELCGVGPDDSDADEDAADVAPYARIESLRVAGAQVSPRRFAIMDLTPLDMQLGAGVAGVVGHQGLPPRFTLDFRQLRMRPELDASATWPHVAPLRFEPGLGPTVAASINGAEPVRLVVDTAFGGVIAAPRDSAQTWGLLDAYTPRLELQGVEADDEPDGAVHIRLEILSVAGATFERPLCAVTPTGTPPRLGLGFLKHFQVGFDFIAGEMRLRRDGAQPLRDRPVIGVGLTPWRYEPPYWSVLVAKDSPADQAGLLPGDRLAEVNGLSLEGLSYEDVQRSLVGEVGELFELGVVRGGEYGIIDLVARELL